jgi:hypothetical protein
MSNQFRRTAVGVGLALSLMLSAAPAVHAAPAAPAKTSGHATRTAGRPAGPSLLGALWNFVVGGNPYIPRPTQGPTVDPNGIS